MKPIKNAWEQLDGLKSAAAIAAWLRRHNIKGHRSAFRTCPLARATGWDVAVFVAENPTTYTYRTLTNPEVRFRARFDAGAYPDLVLKQ